MPSLLVATDFSAAGNHAVDYACRMAAGLQYEVMVLHSYMVPVAFGDTTMTLIPIQDMQRLSEDQLAEFMHGLRSRHPDIRLQQRLEYGDLADCLRDAALSLNPAMVVLGNNGTGNADLWLGSTSVSLLRHLEANVLAIPEVADYHGIRNICLACDFKDIGAQMPIAPLRELLQATGARLHVLHVGSEPAAAERKFEDTILPALLEGCEVAYHYTKAAGSVDEAITRFAEAQQMDWLALIPHHHGFWEGLFHKSHTKAMARMSHIPVLALHPKEKQ